MRHIIIAALTLSAPAASISLAVPAAAQTGQPVSRPLTAMRLLGIWKTPTGSLRFSSSDGKNVTGQFSTGAATYWLKVVNDPQDVGVWVEWEKGRRVDEPNIVGRMLLVPTADSDGFTLTEMYSRPPFWGSGSLTAERYVDRSGWIDRYYAHLLGDWKTTLGDVEVSAEGGHLLVAVTTPNPRPAKPAERWVAAFALPDGLGGETSLHGAWERTVAGGRIQGRAEWNLAPDRKSWKGFRMDTHGFSKESWDGQRHASSEPKPSETSPPSPPPPVVTPPAPVPTAAAFKSLRRVDVRLDRLWEARGYPTRQVHAFVTIKNISAQPQYLTSGYLKAVLTDGDGVAQERNQLWRASAEPAALFASTPVVQPGAEIKVRYVFNPDAGAQPAYFALSEGDLRVEFPASGL